MTKSTAKPARQSHLQWVAADDLRTNPVAQREFRPAWAEKILADFDLDKFQVPHVNRRADGALYIMEGQHGTWAYREFFGEGQQIQVWLYDGLTEQEEAEFFLSLNNKKAVDAMAKFKVGVTAGREVECDIDRIVRANGCHVSSNTADKNAIAAVGALTSIYNRQGAANLGQTLRIIGDSFTEGGYERPILLGVSMALARYPQMEVAHLVKQLAAIRNGWKGLIQRMNLIKESMGCRLDEAAAAAVVEFYNQGRRGSKKLPKWWREDALEVVA